MTEDDLLVAEVAKALLERAADAEPAVTAERRAFDVLSEAYFADPKRALAGNGNGGGYLKFGLPGIEELLTPVFLAAGAEVVKYLSGRVEGFSRKTVRRILSRPAPREVPQLTVEQWAYVRTVVENSLMQHTKMSPQRAETIASAVVGDGIAGPDRAA
ncbi:hypothetical protein [Paractinoplanes durhamensis]|uniref:Uncharacterized protein n=1 Tax=Paractinoplanes durhamensis TaxID=113563 RepID=A0ABQ3YVV4_9ACTN|nr:hypothetical protein [Actinoplanes durhamensis]GIE01721.1 hypothetical protein Adu01nite_30710 [Actinoplanes durhamensis]